MNTEARGPRALPNLSLVLLPLLVGLVGCGGKYATEAVEGTVTDAAGKPLADVLVVFERTAEPMVSRGITDANGRFRLGTTRPGEGAPVGSYRVVMSQQPQVDPDVAVPRRFATRYGSPETSGIEVEVVSGRNRFDFKLDPSEE